jgi:PAS domain S-box-containing protein
MISMTEVTLDRSILVVDDDADIRESLRDMLEHEGYRVHLVGTGTDAICEAKQAHYGAVILDIGLPDLDGHAVFHALSLADPQLPVIIMTAQGTEQNTVGPLAKGAFAYVVKPYNSAAVKAVIRRACDVRALSVKAEHVAHALSESEERFRSVVSSTSDAVVIAEGNGRIVFWNTSAKRMFLYEEGEVLGQPLTMIMPTRYHEAHQRGLERVTVTGESRMLGRPIELYGLRKDGTEFPFELSLAVWKTPQHTCFGGIIRDITERKRVETALRRSEEQFRQLAENIKEVFWLTDVPHTEMIYISPAYEEIWGRSCQSLYRHPQSWMDAIHPDDRERVQAALQWEASGDYHEEYRIIRPDGTIQWILDRAFPIRDDSGTVYRIAGIAECITEQKVADQRQAAQYAVTRVLAEASTLAEASPLILQAICEGLGWDIGAIWIVDEPAGGLHCLNLWHSPKMAGGDFINSTQQAVFHKGIGLPGRVLAGGEPAWIADVMDDANFPRAPTAALAGLHGALAFPIKLNGQVHGVLEFFSREIRRPDDDLLRMLSAIGSQIGQFIERKHIQQALHHAYDKLDAILISLPCLILIVDEDLHVAYANPQADRHLRPENATLTGSRLQDVFPLPADQWARLVEDLQSAASHGSAMEEHDIEVRKHVYRYRPFPVTLHSHPRRPAGLVLWDVTEQKQLQDQLIQAEKLSSLGTLVSGMAHEINNPVQGILGMAEIILQEDDPEKMKQYARDIVDCSTHVGEVVRNFACYARPASRDSETGIDVCERIVEAVRLVQRCPQFGHVEVITQFQPTRTFRACRTEIDQVFVNLISNAVEAMGGAGQLTLRACVQGDSVTASIQDTGCGIPPHLIGKIFDPFVTTKDPGKGTGLGLSIVYKIVAKYGGRIAVDSEEGKGSTFTVEFPITRT